jgi:hypothetical protein
MTIKETLLAFACGVAAITTTQTLIVELNARAASGEAIDVCVNGDGVMRLLDGSCSDGEQRVRLKEPEVEKSCEKQQQAEVARLGNRIAALEAKTDVDDQNKATAPFEVVNEAGIVVFSVNEPKGDDLPALTQIFDETGARIATIAARSAGGEVSVSSAGPANGASQSPSGVDATLAAWGEYADFSVTANSNHRLELGRRRPGGNYALRTFNDGGKFVAGVGESTDGPGSALIFDALGKTRIALHCGTALGPGRVEVYDAAIRPVASLSGKGDASSGVLLLTNNSGEPMVKAHVFPKGLGAVQAGPGAFQHGAMFAGLPASYIEGKKP